MQLTLCHLLALHEIDERLSAPPEDGIDGTGFKAVGVTLGGKCSGESKAERSTVNSYRRYTMGTYNV